MKNWYTFLFSILAAGMLFSCGKDNTKPFIEYAPQMYHSFPLAPFKQIGYNPYFKNGMNQQMPVPGTVARGKSDYFYPYEATPEGYEKAGAELQNPVPFTKETVDEGKRLYKIYCQHCHGSKGAGDGKVAPKISQPPPYNSARVQALTDGHMYHSITYGYNPYPAKGMGAHGSQLSPSERWHVIHYIKTLRGDAIPGTIAVSDSTASTDEASTATDLPENAGH